MGVSVTKEIPEFKAKDQDGNEISSSKQYGKKWVLYFYPQDLTPTCINQACNIRDNYQRLVDHGIDIFGVSMDSEKKHQRFIKRYQLPFPLIVDTEKKLIEAFGCWGKKKLFGREYNGILRRTFVMNERNELIGLIEKPKVKAHVDEILEIYGL